MAFLRQTSTLIAKNLKILVYRHAAATLVRAIILPVALAVVLSFVRNFYVVPAVFGIGDAHPVRSLQRGLAIASKTGHTTVTFVNNGHEGGDIDRVIDVVAGIVMTSGQNAIKMSDPSDLALACRSSLRGVSPCYGAVVFNSSPREGNGGIWNYTLRADGELGIGKIDVGLTTNDAQVYSLPLQRVVDSAIANISSKAVLPEYTLEYPFTSLTPQQRAQRIREKYMAAITNYLGVAFIAVVVGVCYHMTGFMATERETGMSQLIDAMMSTDHMWEAQAARLLSYHVAFTLVYLPGWVVSAIVIGTQVFPATNFGIVVIFFVLSGLALTSLSILGAVFFKKAQVSGVVCVMTYCLLAVFAQILTAPKTSPVEGLSLLFTPCNFVYFITYLARFQQQPVPANLSKIAPGSPWRVSGITLWCFLVGQIVVYPILGAYIEREIHGTTTSGRTILRNHGINGAPDTAVRLEGFTKVYEPNLFRRLLSPLSAPRPPVIAVNKLTLTARRGQILALLGANGSGKSTTLDSIAGLGKLTRGNITIDGTGGLGIAPQKNVLWDELTVREHIEIFNRLKTPDRVASAAEVSELVRKVDLAPKAKAASRTLSGGQKRKLQLGMMLTGGSAVCCVDEVSSGIDPLSRRKVWDILLAERGRRTIILTTHFLDEADLLSDRIAILSKGTLRAEGSSAELKDRLGAGYRIHVPNTRDLEQPPPQVPGVVQKVSFDVISYIARTSAAAAQVIKALEGAGIHDYKYSGPTIEDVFLQVAEEVKEEEETSRTVQEVSAATVTTNFKTEMPEESEDLAQALEAPTDNLRLLSGRRIGYIKQTKILFLKRCSVFKGNWFPSLAALLIPIVTAILVSFFVVGQKPIGCNAKEQGQIESQFGYDALNYVDLLNNVSLVAGPRSQFRNVNQLQRLFGPVFQGQIGGNGVAGLSLDQNLHLVDTYDDFNAFIQQNRQNITPAGWWLGDDTTWPTVAYKADTADVFTGVFGQNALDIMLTNLSIATIYMPLEVPWAPNTGNSLQLLIYTGLIMVAYPAFFGLYPNIERRYNVRAMQYSNGVRTVPLWLAHVAFDFLIVLASMVIVTVVFALLAHVWYHLEYLFVIFTLYGLAAILLSYVVSLFCKNQLSTYAFAAAIQAIGFLAYLLGYLCVYTYVAVDQIDHGLRLVHFIVAGIVPIGSVMHTMFTVLNLFSSACTSEGKLSDNPGSWYIYGAPIVYLLVQSVLLFGVLLWYDSGVGTSLIHRLTGKAIEMDEDDDDDKTISDQEAANQAASAMVRPQRHDGLSVRHLTKSFGKYTAVDNVSFDVQHDEVFALLGTNGAGKSTTISLIRGDMQPSRRHGGDVFIEETSVTRHRAAARRHLGVCPQVDAVDAMTVLDHLRFYARIRGVPDVAHNVAAVLRAVGLEQFANRQAHALSGGNKRKLSLGIALMGNPSVVLLDEPSSGLDAAAKRIMWRTLAAVSRGRSILLTTHSMEEADALASRVGFLARRMLAEGSVDDLRRQLGDTLHVHLVCRSAPRPTALEMDRLRRWVVSSYPGADIDDLGDSTCHGQLRFSVPAASVVAPGLALAAPPALAGYGISYYGGGSSGNNDAKHSGGSAVGQLIMDLEAHKEELGVEYYSVSPTSLDQVFLAIVGAHHVREENYDGYGGSEGEGGVGVVEVNVPRSRQVQQRPMMQKSGGSWL